MRIIGRIHQYAVAEKVGNHARHLLTFMDHDAGEEASVGHVFAGLVGQGFRQGVGHIDTLIVHARAPERQPTEARLQDAVANARIAVHDTGAEKRAYCSHRAPRVRGRSADKRIIPEITVPGVAAGEAVMRDAKPSLIGRGPDWLQVRMVDGNAFGEIRMNADGPGRARPSSDFFDRCFDRPAAHHDERF